MRETITYLEMTGRDELNPAQPVPALTLAKAAAGSPLIRDVAERVGRPCRWSCLSWTDAQWVDFLTDPHVQGWLLTYDGGRAGLRHAGMAACRVHPGAEVEITHFGLMPEFIGRGLGGHALTLTIRTAWSLLPGARRVWLHTSTLDHPNALPNYRRRGLRPYRTVLRDQS